MTPRTTKTKAVAAGQRGAAVIAVGTIEVITLGTKAVIAASTKP